MKKEDCLKAIKESLSYGQLDDALRVWQECYHYISIEEFVQCNEGAGVLSVDEYVQYMKEHRDIYDRAIADLSPHTKEAPEVIYGPKVTVLRECYNCPACVSESYRVQGDSGSDVYCAHPNFANEKEGRKFIRDTSWRTPEWCPVLHGQLP